MTALRAFEAAGRRLNFTQAGAELHVTAGAVSRQIKLLEEFLGLRVFDRTHREVRLTPAGRAYFLAVTDIFARLDKATDALIPRPDRALTVGCSITFARNWLVPRLIQFHAAFPGRVIKVRTSLKPLKFEPEEDELDIAVRIGTGSWKNSVSHHLMATNLVPICSPRLMQQRHPLRSASDLEHHMLLHSKARPNNWPKWLKSVGVTRVDATRGIQYDSSSLAYQAAIDGVGIAIGQHVLISEDLALGRLVMPFNTIVSEGAGYYVVYPEHMQKQREIMEFCDWIVGEAKREEEVRRQEMAVGSLSLIEASD